MSNGVGQSSQGGCGVISAMGISGLAGLRPSRIFYSVPMVISRDRTGKAPARKAAKSWMEIEGRIQSD